jgi:tetratricopeptide (TPR) repeat protein
MTFIKKIFVIKLLILCAIAFNNLKSQDLKFIIEYADNQFNSENYNIALKEYKRALFFSKDSLKNVLLEKTGDSYFELGTIDSALNYYNLAKSTVINDSVKISLAFKTSLCYIFEEKYNEALIQLYQIDNNLGLENQKRMSFYKAVCFYSLENYKSSEEYFTKCLDSTDIEQINNLKSIFKKTEKFNKPNPKVAFFLSLLIPGSGQIYCTEYMDGINSLILSSAIIYTGYLIYLNYTVFDVILSVTTIFERYYLGGGVNAYNSAVKKQNEKKSECYNEIMQIIESEKKKKPENH